ncbi:MAG TPA: hypothetical protein VF177_22090 [Anaerolineae bacterium]
MLQRKLTYMVLGGLVALALVFGAFATFAQTDGDDDDDTATATPEAETEDGSSGETTIPDWGRRGRRGPDGVASNELLVEALGITVEELEAAQEEARAAAIEQAVTDGLLTQEQADQLLENGFGGRGRHFGLGRDTFLAEALGISVEELQAARMEVYEAQLAEMVAAGAITEEQADLMLAQKAVQGYIDVEALQATLQEAYEDAVAQALADGVITQEQADQLLSTPAFGFPGFGGGFGRHHHRWGGPGGFGRFAPAPDTESAPTDTGDNA